jgi:peptidoglycan hydrolase-like protein with peptidoglycan-binding domain
MTRTLLAAAVAAATVVLAAPASGAVTLTATPATVVSGGTVVFAGDITPAAVWRVRLLRIVGHDERLVAVRRSGAAGRFRIETSVWRPGRFVAEAAGARSGEVVVGARPRLRAHFEGLSVLGARLRVEGRLRPPGAGSLKLTAAGRTRVLDVGTDGAFRARLPTTTAGELKVSLVVTPSPGYVRAKRVLRTTIRTPILSIGSHGRATAFLERRLHDLRYSLVKRDEHYRSDTRDAVFAFQKVEGLLVDGVAGPEVWKALLDARVPTAGVPSGRHIEVDKGRQVLFEVRRGKVRHVVHVSTGATGNTPLGRWKIYRKTPGYNSLRMYYAMYFLRGFAIHGYDPVPPFPASHGCVRTPIWFAPRIYRRWPLGSVVWVLPTTARSSAGWTDPSLIAARPAPRRATGCGP